MKKAITCFCVLLLAVSAILSGCNGNDEMSKDEIISLVLTNKESLLNDISKENYENCKRIPEIKEVNVHDHYIEFYCGGSGMGGETTYSGFCYFDAHVQQNIFDMLEQRSYVREGDGYIWRQADGDNIIYIEQITEAFYYYYLEY